MENCGTCQANHKNTEKQKRKGSPESLCLQIAMKTDDTRLSRKAGKKLCDKQEEYKNAIQPFIRRVCLHVAVCSM